MRSHPTRTPSTAGNALGIEWVACIKRVTNMVEITQYNENLDRVSHRTTRDEYSCRFCPARATEPDGVDHCEPCPVTSEKDGETA